VGSAASGGHQAAGRSRSRASESKRRVLVWSRREAPSKRRGFWGSGRPPGLLRASPSDQCWPTAIVGSSLDDLKMTRVG